MRGRKFNIENAIKNNVPKELWSKLQKSNEVELEGVKYNSSMVLGDERKGIKIVYATDTRPTKELPDFIKDSDLYISEGTYGDDEDLHKAIESLPDKNRMVFVLVEVEGYKHKEVAEMIDEFAKRLGTQMVHFLPRDNDVQRAEINKMTVIEWNPEVPQADEYRMLAKNIDENEMFVIPKPIQQEELEKILIEYGMLG